METINEVNIGAPVDCPDQSCFIHLALKILSYEKARELMLTGCFPCLDREAIFTEIDERITLLYVNI